MKRILYLANLAIALIVLPAWSSLWGQGTGNMQTIYSFEAPPSATYPAAGPLVSPGSVIYGTTAGGGTVTGSDCGFFSCGTVYELIPPASPGEAWAETTLYSFSPYGGAYGPTTGLVSGASGRLYGWANGGSHGLVFELTPPAAPGGAWTETTVYSFNGPPSDGGIPAGGLAIAKNGSLYGTTGNGGTYNQGTVFELTPPGSPGGAWTLTVLYSFHGDGDGIQPGAGVIVGDKGVIYGTTLQGGALGFGTVFRLQLVAGDWEEKILSSLDSGVQLPAGLALGKNGVLYGQAERGGIFEAMPPATSGGAWTVESLYNVTSYPYATSITVGPTAAIYWTTSGGGTSTACGVSFGCGTLNELMPPTSAGGTWTPVVLHNFTGQHGDGYQPNPGLAITKNGAVYGTTYYGGDNFFGTVFRYTP